jgi:predicted peroxiredoxin
MVCKPCAETRLIGEDDLPPDCKTGTGVTLIDLAVEAKVFSF